MIADLLIILFFTLKPISRSVRGYLQLSNGYGQLIFYLLIGKKENTCKKAVLDMANCRIKICYLARFREDLGYE